MFSKETITLKSTSAIIVAAGSGTRMKSSVPKPFLALDNNTILYHTIQRFLPVADILEIIIVTSSQLLTSECLRASIPKSAPISIRTIAGGKRRQDSVYNALQAVNPDSTIVCIHDGVRPFIHPDTIARTIKLCDLYDGAIVAVPSINTLKQIQDQLIVKTIDRDIIWQAQTPQTFRKDILINAYKQAFRHNITGTDDASLIEQTGGRIAIVEGSPWNIKITGRQDLFIAQSILDKGAI